MYAGRPAGKLPYGIGERSNAPFNLAGVPASGFGPYLGDFFDDVAKIAGKVGTVAGELSKVNTGQATIATVPTGYSSFTVPVGTGVSASIPTWVLGAGIGVLVLLAMRKR